MDERVKKTYLKIVALRNAATLILEELDAILAQTAPSVEGPRIRRNLKQERINEFETNLAAGTWRKPKHLRKTKSK